MNYLTNDHTFKNYFWRYIKNLFIIKYYIFSNVKTRFFLASSVLLIGFLSCKKTYMIQLPEAVVPAPVDVTKLSDSCAYTLDGIPYICDKIYSGGGGNYGANLDTNGGWKWDPDTLLYSRSYSIRSTGVYGSYGGDLTIRLAKKFAKSQLTRNVDFIKAPVSDTLLYYPKGEQKYAVDFGGFNRHNGVVLEIPTHIGYVIGNQLPNLTTNTDKVYIPTTINADSQKDSKFEITNVYFFPANGVWLDHHILEAKFSAIVFDIYEKPHRLENGYIRIHVN